jgi:PhnB protein
MANAVKPIPDGYHTLTPYLIVKGVKEALDYYEKAFDANVFVQMPAPDGKIVHAEFRIGDSALMIGEEMPDARQGYRGPAALGGTPVGLMIYVNDVDAQFAKAVEAGGKIEKPITNQFYGDRSGTITDPFGHKWTIATHIEDVSEEELGRRFNEMMKQQG